MAAALVARGLTWTEAWELTPAEAAAAIDALDGARIAMAPPSST